MRAVVPVLALLAVVALAVGFAGVTRWWLLATLLLPGALLLARDRAAGLGHALSAGHVVARSGSLDRRHEALAVPGVIGWNLRSTWFQRRAGLTTLVATTAGGRQAVTVPDVPDRAAVSLAHRAHPDLLGQFLETASVPTGS